jgi:hypothetical protein
MREMQNAECRMQKQKRSNSAFCILHFAFVFLLLIATDLHACPVCFGDPNAPMQKGVNSGIWVLLGVIGSVQVGFVALFWSFRQRARELQRRRESLKVIEGGVR